jgi:hypothetical protein
MYEAIGRGAASAGDGLNAAAGRAGGTSIALDTRRPWSSSPWPRPSQHPLWSSERASASTWSSERSGAQQHVSTDDCIIEHQRYVRPAVSAAESTSAERQSANILRVTAPARDVTPPWERERSAVSRVANIREPAG